MAITGLMISWMKHLAEQKGMRANSLLDLGPQDVHLSEKRLSELVPGLLDKLKSTSRKLPRVQDILYKELFGIENYYSCDFGDPNATFQIDLNESSGMILADGPFDIVTNFGTSEHIYNISGSFNFVLSNVAPGGFMLFSLPAYGDINHGFYNIHPTLYWDLAFRNKLEIIDFCYLDDVGHREGDFNRSSTAAFNFDDLPVTIDYSKPNFRFHDVNPNFKAVAELNYFKNLRNSTSFISDLKLHSRSIFDYCFVAIKKPMDRLPGRNFTNLVLSPVQSLYRDFSFD